MSDQTPQSQIERLTKLAQLKADGAITDAEFLSLKSKLLGRSPQNNQIRVGDFSHSSLRPDSTYAAAAQQKSIVVLLVIVGLIVLVSGIFVLGDVPSSLRDVFRPTAESFSEHTPIAGDASSPLALALESPSRAGPGSASLETIDANARASDSSTSAEGERQSEPPALGAKEQTELPAAPMLLVGANPSFDCTATKIEAERLICGDVTLAELDVKMAALYRQALTTVGDPAALRKEQRTWLSERNACTTKGCLSTAFSNRMATLDSARSSTPAFAHTAATIPPRSNPRRPVSQPAYPPASKRLGEAGTVVMLLTVDEDGKVLDAKLDKSSGFVRLDEAAMKEALQTWRLLPGTVDGKPIKMQYKFAVTFKIYR